MFRGQLATRGILAREPDGREPSAQEISVKADDRVSARKIVEGHAGDAMGLAVSRGDAAADRAVERDVAAAGERLQKRSDGCLGRGSRDAGRDEGELRAVALVASEGRGDGGVEFRPVGLDAADLRLLEPVTVVQIDHRCLATRADGASGEGVLRVALDLHGAAVTRLHHETAFHRATATGGGVVGRRAGRDVLGLVDVGDDFLDRTAGAAARDRSRGERGADQLHEVAALDLRAVA